MPFVGKGINEVDCIDEEKSKFKKFEINDPVRPDLANPLKIPFLNNEKDAHRTSWSNEFRLKNIPNKGITDARYSNPTRDFNQSLSHYS